MRAQFIYENLDFERGREPKETLGIGIEQQLLKLLDGQASKSGYERNTGLIDPKENEVMVWTNDTEKNTDTIRRFVILQHSDSTPRTHTSSVDDTSYPDYEIYYDYGNRIQGTIAVDHFINTYWR